MVKRLSYSNSLRKLSHSQIKDVSDVYYFGKWIGTITAYPHEHRQYCTLGFEGFDAYHNAHVDISYLTSYIRRHYDVYFANKAVKKDN